MSNLKPQNTLEHCDCVFKALFDISPFTWIVHVLYSCNSNINI